MYELVSLVAGSLADVLLGPVFDEMKRRVAGSAEHREVQSICRKALERAVRGSETSGGVAEVDVSASLALFHDFLLSLPMDAFPVIAPDPADVQARLDEWRVAADADGKDRDTWPMGFDVVVRRLFAFLPEEFEAAGRRPGTAVFPTVVLENLGLLRARVGALLAGQANALPLASPLAESLEAARLRCVTADRAFSRADLLYALLAIKGGTASAALDAASPGEAAEVRNQLGRYFAGPMAPHPFVSFDVKELPDLAEAGRIAIAEGLPRVSDACAFLAVMGGTSQTIAQLKHRLGPARLQRAIAIATKRLGNEGPSPTPGRIIE
jgi:hypothetical protein